MPRAFRFKPGFRAARKTAGLSPWAVNVPGFLSSTGKRQELFCSTKTEAQAECDRLKARKENFGVALASLSAAQIAEAAKAFDLLKPCGIGLLKAVTDYLAIQDHRTASISFRELCDRYLEAKANKHPQHLKGLRSTRNRLPSLHDLLVSDIDHRTLEPLVNAIVPGGRNLVLRHLASIFNYGVKKGYLTVNPISALDFVESKKKEVEVISPECVHKMLDHALAHDVQMLPYLTLAFFTGIRPEEILQLRWEDVDMTSKEIRLRAEVSKTGTTRFPVFSENAVLWIEAYRQAGGTMTGPIVGFRDRACLVHLAKIRKAAGIDRWPHDAARHSFCSYWLAVNKDVNRLLLLVGHRSPQMLWRHYYRSVSEAAAAEFWDLVPPAAASNVIAFKA